MSDLETVMKRLNAQMPEELPQPADPVPTGPANELRDAVRAALRAMDGNGHIPGSYIRKLRALVDMPE